MRLVNFIAQNVGRIPRLIHNQDMLDRVTDGLERLVKSRMPHGSGFDAGTHLDFDKSTEDRLVFTTSFHHMDEHGGYDGWTEHKVIVTPSFIAGYTVKITGRDRNQTKDYIADTIHHILSEEGGDWAAFNG